MVAPSSPAVAPGCYSHGPAQVRVQEQLRQKSAWRPPVKLCGRTVIGAPEDIDRGTVPEGHDEDGDQDVLGDHQGYDGRDGPQGAAPGGEADGDGRDVDLPPAQAYPSEPVVLAEGGA